jgi:hypothetical protein
MQPYFMPYIGYFQLMAAVDEFVVFDDVNYINRGWINRNRLLLNGVAHTFTVPLSGASQNKLICEIELVPGQAWREKLLRKVRQAYCKAPFYEQVFVLLTAVINYPTNRLDAFLLNSLRTIANYMAIQTEIVASSRVYSNATLKGQARILDICRQEKADSYINPIGGTALYDRAEFVRQGVTLQFLQSRHIGYPQGNNTFVPCLSILDVLMFTGSSQVRQMLLEMDLI